MKELRQTKSKNGFIGNARVYDETIFVNTTTGEGYNKVIHKMSAYINQYASKIRLHGFEREDIRQLIITILLDGIRRYNPQLNIKLSTFLYIHIKNRIISRIKEDNKRSSNATQNEALYKIVCSCGNSMLIPKSEDIQCDSCLNYFDTTWSVKLACYRTLSLDNMINDNDYDPKLLTSINTFNNVEKKLDFVRLMKNEDKITRKIAEMVYLDDHSISDAAAAVGLSCWAASLRLKRMAHRSDIKEFFAADGSI